MRFQRNEDLVKSLSMSVFYSPKLKKAVRLHPNEGLTLVPFAASDEAFDKKLPSIDARKEFHLPVLTSGFAPRTLEGALIAADRRPARQWHFGWNPQNTTFAVVSGRGGKFSSAMINVNRDWGTNYGFLGKCWTGGFKSFKTAIEDKHCALSPSLAISDGKLVSLIDVIGEVINAKTVGVHSEFYNSFIVRELKDFGVEEVKEI